MCRVAYRWPSAESESSRVGDEVPPSILRHLQALQRLLKALHCLLHSSPHNLPSIRPPKNKGKDPPILVADGMVIPASLQHRSTRDQYSSPALCVQNLVSKHIKALQDLLGGAIGKIEVPSLVIQSYVASGAMHGAVSSEVGAGSLLRGSSEEDKPPPRGNAFQSALFFLCATLFKDGLPLSCQALCLFFGSQYLRARLPPSTPFATVTPLARTSSRRPGSARRRGRVGDGRYSGRGGYDGRLPPVRLPSFRVRGWIADDKGVIENSTILVTLILTDVLVCRIERRYVEVGNIVRAVLFEGAELENGQKKSWQLARKHSLGESCTSFGAR